MATSNSIIVKAEWWLVVIIREIVAPLADGGYKAPAWFIRALDGALYRGLHVERRLSPHSVRFYRRMGVKNGQ